MISQHFRFKKGYTFAKKGAAIKKQILGLINRALPAFSNQPKQWRRSACGWLEKELRHGYNKS